MQELFDKTISVIESCTTQEQLKAAITYTRLAEKRLDNAFVSIFFESAIYMKKQLLKGK